jgi:hypothetical protein
MHGDDELQPGRAPVPITDDAGNILPFPAPAAPPKPLRIRHDGFTPARQAKFLKALKKCGCLTDAAGTVGISTNTVRRHRDKWPEFDEKVEAALAIASVELDMIAWKRATEGTEKVYRDGRLVFTRVKPSDSILRLIMQGANPGKCGRQGMMPKRAVMKKLRKEAQAEAKAAMRASIEQVTASLEKGLAILRRRRIAEGYEEGAAGMLVPPGYKMVEERTE